MTILQKQRILILRPGEKKHKEIAVEMGLTLGCVKMAMPRQKREGEWGNPGKQKSGEKPLFLADMEAQNLTLKSHRAYHLFLLFRT